jgi:hypothetical protein
MTTDTLLHLFINSPFPKVNYYTDFMALISNLTLLLFTCFQFGTIKSFHKYLHVLVVVETNILLAIDTIQYE